MSNFTFQARHKQSGAIVDVTAIDNWYGPHKYAYVIGDEFPTSEEIFYKKYEVIKDA